MIIVWLKPNNELNIIIKFKEYYDIIRPVNSFCLNLEVSAEAIQDSSNRPIYYFNPSL